jgi:hypothetical protein
MPLQPVWIADDQPDCHVAFRGEFTLGAPAEVEVASLGSAWFDLELDGDWLDEGPWRFHPRRPEHALARRRLAAGDHWLTLHAHHQGVHTRLMRLMPAFIACAVRAGGSELAVRWRARRIEGYRRSVARVNPQLGWIEWCDTRADPAGWRDAGFDASAWETPRTVDAGLPASVPLAAGSLRRDGVAPRLAGEGLLAERFGYELDDPAARFALRDLSPSLPPQGLWRRYDLGRIRLGRPRLTIDAPAGAVVELALSENLTDGRVAPWITLSAGRSCALDHWVARGGPQVFSTADPRSGRWLEVHVLAPPAAARVLEAGFLERGWFGEPVGALACGDERLDRIWSLGVETLRACAEDAIIDNPTRERGQWTGDVAVSLEVAAAAYADLRLLRRGLEQAALDAREDGLVSGLSPADSLGMTTYAMHWVGACVRYHRFTGDRALLDELLPAARANLAALAKGERDGALQDGLGWGFVDWGYASSEAPDLAVNLHYRCALEDFCAWCDLIGADPGWERIRLVKVRTALEARTRAAGGWASVGFHAAALALRDGLVPEAGRAAACDAILAHLARCFPNDPDAPRLSDPNAAQPRLITPYFLNAALDALARAGRVDQAIAHIRSCWGWMLDLGATTCLEVFDPRWSWCHAWSACPTWQLPRWLLGLERRFDLGDGHFALELRPGSREGASGRVPTVGGALSVRWRRDGSRIVWHVDTPVPITVHPPGESALTIERSGDIILRV